VIDGQRRNRCSTPLRVSRYGRLERGRDAANQKHRRENVMAA
jgi:hypothetical protein